MVKRKGSANSRETSVAQGQATINSTPEGDLALKMDQILEMIQGYEGNTNTVVVLMIDMQKKFEEKLEALRLENDAIKAQLDQHT